MIEHPFPFGPRWSARSIWFETPRLPMASMIEPVLAGSVVDRFGLFRRLTLAGVPNRVAARVWDHARSVLSVDGAEIGRGPVRANPRRAALRCLRPGAVAHRRRQLDRHPGAPLTASPHELAI